MTPPYYRAELILGVNLILGTNLVPGPNLPLGPNLIPTVVELRLGNTSPYFYIVCWGCVQYTLVITFVEYVEFLSSMLRLCLVFVCVLHLSVSPLPPLPPRAPRLRQRRRPSYCRQPLPQAPWTAKGPPRIDNMSHMISTL